MENLNEYEKDLLILNGLYLAAMVICMIVHFCIGGSFEVKTTASDFGIIALACSISVNGCHKLYRNYKQ